MSENKLGEKSAEKVLTEICERVGRLLEIRVELCPWTSGIHVWTPSPEWLHNEMTEDDNLKKEIIELIGAAKEEFDGADNRQPGLLSLPPEILQDHICPNFDDEICQKVKVFKVEFYDEWYKDFYGYTVVFLEFNFKELSINKLALSSKEGFKLALNYWYDFVRIKDLGNIYHQVRNLPVEIKVMSPSRENTLWKIYEDIEEIFQIYLDEKFVWVTKTRKYERKGKSTIGESQAICPDFNKDINLNMEVDIYYPDSEIPRFRDLAAILNYHELKVHKLALKSDAGYRRALEYWHNFVTNKADLARTMQQLDKKVEKLNEESHFFLDLFGID